MAAKDLESIGLSSRTVTALMDAGITTPKQLDGKSAAQLKEVKGLGPKSLSEIKTALTQNTEESASEPAELPTAKAGKRSTKAQRERAEQLDKEQRKATTAKDTGDEASSTTKKGPRPVTRPRIERRGKKYREAAKNIDRSKLLPLEEAAALAIAASTVNFDATVELHAKLNVDPKQADQNIRETVSLPHGTGKTLRVAAFASDADQKKALDAGADFAGEAAILDKLKKEELDFDVLIATPQLMSQLGRFAKILGPKGLMPNPKSGTVTNNVGQAVKAAKAGRVELRVDKQGIIHAAIGKVSFGADKITANAQVVLDALKQAKPSSIKTQYVSSIYITTSMGPSVGIETSALTSA